MIHKKKNKLDPNNYRPISLISNLGKLFESTLKYRIYKHTEISNIIPNNQSGFQKKNKNVNDQLFHSINIGIHFTLHH